jgi:hypothetical protein
LGNPVARGDGLEDLSILFVFRKGQDTLRAFRLQPGRWQDAELDMIVHKMNVAITDGVTKIVKPEIEELLALIRKQARRTRL